MQRKSTYQPWSQRKKKTKSLGKKEMLGTSEPTTESQGEEERLADADLQCSQPKSSREKQNMTSVKLKPAVAQVVAGFSGSLSGRSVTKEKERREEMAAAVIQKRRALVAKQFTSPNVGVSNPEEQSLEHVHQSRGETSQERQVQAAGRTRVADPEGDIHTSLEGNPGSDDLLEMSPSYVRKSGMFSEVRKNCTTGSLKKAKYMKNFEIGYTDSFDEEGCSDGERLLHSKIKVHRRQRRETPESSSGDQSPQGYRRYREKRQRRKFSRRCESTSDSERPSPERRFHFRERTRRYRRERDEYDSESYRHKRDIAKEKRITLYNSEDEDEQYGSRHKFSAREHHTLSPTHNNFQLKATSGEETRRAERLLPQVKLEASGRMGKADVKQEALPESTLCRDRKRKQVSREAEVEGREKMGWKPHFLTVDERGRPYRLGAKSWRVELNKLCCALDPSVMDMRNQPHKPMLTLKKRLASKFEYSADIDDDWLRGEIGRGVSARRFRLMAMIRNGDQIPPGFDKDIWYNLQRISDDPKYKEKSQAMRHANSMRRTLGRTGSKGEMGVVEDLREQFGRSPDPDEIEDEMRRNKGYGGGSSKKRRGLSRNESRAGVERSAQATSNLGHGSSRDDGSDGIEQGGGASSDSECDIAGGGKSAGVHTSHTALSDALERESYVQALLKRLADLEARGAAANLLSTSTEIYAEDNRQPMPPHSEEPEGNAEETESGAQNKHVETTGGKRVLRTRVSKGKGVL